MAIIWADFPSGQRGLYGVDISHALNGVWAEIIPSGTALVADPDPTIGSNGIVVQTTGSNIFSFVQGLRFAFPTPRKTEGGSIRLWMSALPVDYAASVVLQWRDASNNPLFSLRVNTNGSINAQAGGFDLLGNWAGTVYGGTAGPVLVANAYNHIEWKVFSNATTGTIEVRVNGVVKMALTALNTNGADIAQFVFGAQNPQSGAVSTTPYWKDLVLWDTVGTYAIDFQGAVAVYDLYPDADISLNWTPSIGATGWPLISDDKPSNTLTASGAINDGEVVRIDNTYYRFSTAGTVDAGAPAGSAANPWRVSLGASIAAALLNFYKAIGASGVAGTDYSTVLTAHTTVNANGVTATAVSVAGKITASSAIVTTETGVNLAWIGNSINLVEGPSDPSYIQAPFPAPAAAVFTLTNLPPDVTSVRALLPIYRSQKTDGGDCNIQSGLSPNNAAWVNGTDQPQTVAFNYWWSASHTSPVTAVPWTPGEVNGAYVRVNRTL